MRILGIETSCDETALALLEAEGGLKSPKFKILKAVISSQIKIHAPFGGVVPNLAKREHIKNLPYLEKKLFGSGTSAKKTWESIDLIAVTVGPGLEPALWAGITFAEELSKKYRTPLIGANHLEGHLWSFLLPQPEARRPTLKDVFPAIGLIVSGGHTNLLLMKDLTHWKQLGETRDDAVGEAFDKVARMLKLPYPGGPQIQKLATQGDCRAINFPQPMKHDKNYDFSFSGLKTSVLYYLRDTKKTKKADVAASFEKAATDVLSYKTLKALDEYKARSVILAGGVAANKALRKKLEEGARTRKKNFFVPEFEHNTDNAVMIAIAGYITKLRKKKYLMKANGLLGV
ncbi:MAG: tRNA (adenosine(37)-N6)-threonylcarbamoyltransferase complex transferase subunit TsaD [Anaplasmataceae bacterium]|nr:tRNA (adenosine(37)-N6)-threonylcarbamoyltransferase complex transferase subunit TsaD [Anaplasmataceae bacterium]